MASDKKRRKASKQDRKQSAPPPTGPFKHPDGDRRRRGLSVRVEDAIEHKRLMRQIGLPPDGDEHDDDEAAE
jgi:hypothetical protein